MIKLIKNNQFIIIMDFGNNVLFVIKKEKY